ncbi:MAG: CARDB domain-containing protein, partial [Patescibacteria group bacterium]|nr:CARDB domain-containing protein [Patescibacteria group bacterium]
RNDSIAMITKTRNSGSYSWDIGVNNGTGAGWTIQPGDHYKIEICSVSNSTVCDVSDNYFSIVAAEQEDPVSGTLSVDKTKVGVGENIELTVTGQDDNGLTKLWAYFHNGWYTDSADGTFHTTTWNFSESTPGTYVYRGYVYGKKLDGTKESKYTTPSSVTVVVTAGEEEKLITVTSPNGGERFKQGDSYTITWRSLGTIDRVKITTCMTPEYYAQSTTGGSRCDIGVITENDGSHSSQIGQAAALGNYKTRIEDASDPAIYDESDNPFRVVSAGQEDVVSGTLSVDKTTVEVGENIELTITGQDDNGLTKLWAYYQGSWHSDYAEGTEYTKTWNFSESTPGTYVYRGYVYGKKLDGTREARYTIPSSVTVVVITDATCSDSDGGKDYYVKGTITEERAGQTYTHTDYCYPGGSVLSEYFCSSSQEEFGVHEDFVCPNGCSDGACKTINPRIGLITPNGGESWTFGEPQTIVWNWQDVENAAIYLKFANAVMCKLADVPHPTGGLPATTRHDVTIQEYQKCSNISSIITEGQYKISIWGSGAGISNDISAPRDESESYFNLVSAEQEESDLIIPSISINKDQGVVYTMKNQGDAFVGTTVTGLYVDRVYKERSYPSHLSAGETTTSFFSDWKCAPSQTYLIKVCADYNRQWTESNENNNCLTRSLICPGTAEQEDPVSGTLSVDKTTVGVGENIELTVTGQDDNGLTKLWAYYQGSWHSDYVNGTEYTKTWNFSESTPGTYVYRGYVYGQKLNGTREAKYTIPSSVTVVVTTDATCSDSDGGTNYYVKGTARSSSSDISGTQDCCKSIYSTYTGDSVNNIGPGGGACVTSGPYLYEAICGRDGNPTVTVYKCPNGCRDGVCLSSAETSASKEELSSMLASMQSAIEKLMAQLRELRK